MNDAPQVDLVVAVVTWRAARLTIDCLASLETSVAADPRVRVVVVDNASGDGTADQIAEAIRANSWDGWVELVRSPRNGGFAAGNNIVFRLALTRYPALEYVLLLNPDTLVRPGALSALRDFLEARPDVGIAGGRCENPDGTPQVCCFRFPGIVGEFATQLRLGLFDRIFRNRVVGMGHHDAPVEAGWVAGAVMMVRRRVLEDVGLMDESYFLYYEETDFSLRARRAGWSTWHVPSSRVVHFVGQLTGVQADNPQPKRLPPYWFESRRRYFVLNHGTAYAAGVDLAVIAGNLLWRLRCFVERKRNVDPPRWITDLVSKGVLRRGRRGLAERRIR